MAVTHSHIEKLITSMPIEECEINQYEGKFSLKITVDTLLNDIKI